MIIYVGLCRPWDEAQMNDLELFNEWTGIVLVYHLMLYTDFYTSDTDTRYYGIGISNMGFLIFNVCINMLRIVLEQWRIIKRACNAKMNERMYLA